MNEKTCFWEKIPSGGRCLFFFGGGGGGNGAGLKTKQKQKNV